MGVASWYDSAFSGLVARLAKIGSQTCLGMMLTLARVLVKNGAYGSFSVNRITLSERFSSLSMIVTNGLYIGTLSPAGRVNESITASPVRGRPPWNFIPLRK